MDERDLNTRAQLLCLGSGPVMLLLFWFGFMFCAGYLPPPSADLAPAALVLRIQSNLTGFRIGMLVTMIGFSLMVPWAVGIAARVRLPEGRYPVLTHTQIGCAAIGSLIGQGSTAQPTPLVRFLEPLDRDPVRTRVPHFLVQGGPVLVEWCDRVFRTRVYILHMGIGLDCAGLQGCPPRFAFATEI